PAQAVWRQHFPMTLYSHMSLKQVIEKNCPGLFYILYKDSDLSKTEDQIFLGLDISRRQGERASFYDWVMWRLDKLHATWEYDYSANVYRILKRPLPPQPFEI